uniref:Homologous-pairing protein 2 winged helix domain-containing protein n=1 Tax=Compsopogon caeruleus TaxID=31354 RepID=A0A6T6AXK2_9RHOD
MSRGKGGKKGSDEESVVEAYLEEKNRPFSVQNIVDALQKDGVKKTACERALASLVEGGKVVCKEYGKAKLYLFRQDNIDVPDGDSLAEMDREIAEKVGQTKELAARCGEEEGEVNALKSTLSEEEAAQRRKSLAESVERLNTKLQALGDISNLVSREEKQREDAKYSIVMVRRA